jgi:hypothetical protein
MTRWLWDHPFTVMAVYAGYAVPLAFVDQAGWISDQTAGLLICAPFFLAVAIAFVRELVREWRS